MYIFVYGTLRYGHERHNVLENARFVGYGFIKGFKLYDLGPYPAIAKENGTVYGEVYEISPETLKTIDWIEGHPTLYKRITVTAYFDESQEHKLENVYTYLYNQPIENAKPIPDGEYSKAKKKPIILNYFAYGSNMSPRRLKERGIKPIKTVKATLNNYRLVFNKKASIEKHCYANIEKAPGEKVYGTLYTITLKQLEELDDHEGHPNHYTRKTVKVHDEKQKPYFAQTYTATHPLEKEGKPAKWYLEYIIEGLQKIGWKKEALRLRKKFNLM